MVDSKETKAMIKNRMEEKLVDDTLELVVSFLSDNDVARFSESALFAYNAGKERLAERNAKKLLSYVFNADPASLNNVFNRFAKPEWLLIKTSFNEGYFIEKIRDCFFIENLRESKEWPTGSLFVQEFVCVRRWKSVSPLQAAALCLDNFLLKKMLDYIVNDEKLRLDAGKQLEEIRSRTGEMKRKKEKDERTVTSEQTTIQKVKQF